MRTAVAVPWRPGNAWRERSWQYVQGHLERCGYQPFTFDSGHQPFNRAASRNLAAALDVDVIIFHDADMVAPRDAYADLALTAHETSRMVVGFRHYRALDKSGTLTVLAGADPFTQEPLAELTDFSVGGIFALTPDAWNAVGGMDERFIDWGCEDFAFAKAAAALGPMLRTENSAVHLWHPHAGNHEHIDHNAALLAEGSNP